jgi:hypothetical protein
MTTDFVGYGVVGVGALFLFVMLFVAVKGLFYDWVDYRYRIKKERDKLK